MKRKKCNCNQNCPPYFHPRFTALDGCTRVGIAAAFACLEAVLALAVGSEVAAQLPTTLLPVSHAAAAPSRTTDCLVAAALLALGAAAVCFMQAHFLAAGRLPFTMCAFGAASCSTLCALQPVSATVERALALPAAPARAVLQSALSLPC